MSEDVSPARASVRVVRGEPDDAELAALVAGLVATSGRGEDAADSPPASAWNDRARSLRLGRPDPGQAPGPDAWRWSSRR